MGEQLLEEVEASIVVSDLRDFHLLADRLGPVELGLALSSYYGHIGGIVESHGGRIVKFIGDGVLVAFVDGDHRTRALAAIADMARSRDGWLADNAKVRAPALDYSVGAASGALLCGPLGTDRIHFWDVLGAPVNLAFRICALAADRKLPELIAADTVEGGGRGVPALVEVEAAEIGGRRHRLFRFAP